MLMYIMLSALSTDRKKLKNHSLAITLCGVALIVSGVLRLDPVIADFFSRPELEWYYKFNREITNIGYSIHYFVISLAVYLFARFFYDKTRLKTKVDLKVSMMAWSLFTVKTLIYIGLIGQLIKFIVGRQRPHLSPEFESTVFSPFSTHWHWHSFPSGHTQVLLTVSTIAALIWPRFTIWFLSIGVYLAFSRVVIHQHHFSDFIGGALLGYLLTLWIYNKWPPQKAS